MPKQMSGERTGRSKPLTVAVVITGLTTLVLAGLGVSVMAQQHGRFSAGVGLALLLYGLLVGVVAWLAWQRHSLGYGPMVAFNVLHGFVIGSTANGSHAWWLWFGLVPVAIAVVCMLMPVTRAEFGRLGSRPTQD